jgi:KUP system potassium uptake protein
VEAPSDKPVEIPCEPPHPAEAAAVSPRRLAPLAVAALGVVYGDIGTSPLYAVRSCFRPEDYAPAVPAHQVLGVVSLIFWALTLVVVVKYLTVVLRADNHGEGGILALLALLTGGPGAPSPRRRAVLASLAVFGTALLLADGMITPAISVLSALEGLQVAAPRTGKFVMPLTVFILIGLFVVQSLGTARIARLFGPTMLLWFVMIALLGLQWVVRQPEILAALDPRRGLHMFPAHPGRAFFLLGAIVLCVTGAEALYADLGHFGRGPIRLAWYGVAYPALLLNYFGQGAFVLSLDGRTFTADAPGGPGTINLFFHMVPPGLLYPVLIVSTLATIIASQALISGAYSLAKQAVQLGYSPRLTIIHTSGQMIGQIYVPFVNWALMIACVFLVVLFRTSANLADAYGLAVIGTMLITSLLMFQVMRSVWRWSLPAAGALLTLFLIVDVPFVVSNLGKIPTGGWVPLLVGGILFTMMSTWRRGRALLMDPSRRGEATSTLQSFVERLEEKKPIRDAETAIVLAAHEDTLPFAFLELVRRMNVTPQRLVVLTVRAQPVPKVAEDNAIEIRKYEQGCYGVTAKHGFMEAPNVARFLDLCTSKGLELDSRKVYFYLSRLTVVTTGQAKLPAWQKSLFSIMYHNSQPATSHYHLPPDRVVELGQMVEL